ncbi:UDP-glucose 4-epimerase [Poriferisphaera corsica]|uniref:UDP-glucose 4-epimerase n=1 Tax=Poriferisphaera corsica TaxID=2528020 RepID=A0A517YSK7_9BACT|nr:UDP-glucose 4-epimerase GalE [Poriferisphaera corsica]QDU33219.1 UDP-glucose 4-epimerase [Poriferisphaera corsica]
MKVLVTGGAGYIGSHAVKHLDESGHDVIAVDNLSLGHRAAVAEHIPFYQTDIRNVAEMYEILKDHEIECVMHFAAFSQVGESVGDPLKYYDNNTYGSTCLLQAMNEAGVKKLVFSSTCATYGEPEEVPIAETCKQNPINPYGWSKLFVERMLKDYAAANKDFAYSALRYFNVAGSAADGKIGEDHHPETHIIPVILQAALGQRDAITIFGKDYPTPDGTCIRDYIHVEDLVDAHAVVMGALQPGDARIYNLGIGNGLSVKQIVDAAKKATQIDFQVNDGDRRAGDPPMLYANPSKIKEELGWEAKYRDVEKIIETAWRWFRANPDGYNDR